MMQLTQTTQQRQQLSPSMIFSLKVLEMNEAMLESYVSDLMDTNCVLEMDSSPHVAAGSAAYDDAIEAETPFDLHAWIKLQIAYDSEDEALMDYMIDSLDAKGYFPEDIEAVLQNEFCLSKKEAAHWIQQFQSIQPKGIGARSLKECLLLQLTDPTSLEYKLLHDYEEAVAGALWQTIIEELQVTHAEVMQAMERLRCLNPYPLTQFSMTGQEKVRIDAIVKRDDDGIHIQMNPMYDALHLSQKYCALAGNTNDLETRAYLKEKIKEANQLISSLQKRKDTLLSVLHVLIMKQYEYLFHQQDISILTYRDVAETVGISISTCSRVVKNKWIQVDNHVLSLKSLFSSNRGNHTFHSKKQLARQIQSLHEERFSDAQIEMNLKKQGIRLSRRSINRYRKEYLHAKNKL